LLTNYSGPTFQEVGGSGGATAPLTLTLEDAVNNDVTTLLTLGHNTSGAPAVGLGTGIDFEAETSTTESSLLGKLKMLWRNVTHANRSADIVLTVLHNGTEYIRAVLAGNFDMAGDATDENGNARGQYANDLQGLRWSATKVASGDASVIAGGQNNEASGYAAAVGGGADNIASGDYSSTPGGSGNRATGHWSVALGTGTQADKNTQFALSSGSPAGAFTTLASIFHVRRAITHNSAAWTALQLGPNGLETRLTIASDTVWAFEALIAGATSGMAKTFAFHIQGCIENDGGVTALKGTPTVTVIDNSDDVSFSARATADDTNDALLIEVSDSDGAGDTVRWSARVVTAEVTY
jgi:hypothetical protein